MNLLGTERIQKCENKNQISIKIPQNLPRRLIASESSGRKRSVFFEEKQPTIIKDSFRIKNKSVKSEKNTSLRSNLIDEDDNSLNNIKKQSFVSLKDAM